MPSVFDKFLLWEATSRDIIDFKKIYVDMVNNVNAGLMLSEIVYWYLPSKQDGSSRLRVEHDDFLWIACRRYEWWQRIRLSPEKAEAAIKILLDAKLIFKGIYKFAGSPTVHVRLNQDVFMAMWTNLINNPPVNPYLPADNSDLGKNPKSISGISRNGNGEKPEMVLRKKPKSLTKNTGIDSSIDSYTSRGYAATPEPFIQIIEVWAKSWEGEVSGNPYSNRTNRSDAKKLAESTSLTEIKRYTLAIKEPGKKWANSRPSWGIWFNDIGEWIKKNPANDPEPEPAAESDELTPEQKAMIERQNRVFGGGDK